MIIGLSFFARTAAIAPSRVNTNVFWSPDVQSITPLEGVPNVFTRRAASRRESWVLPPSYRTSMVIKKLVHAESDQLALFDNSLQHAREFTDATHLYAGSVVVNARSVPGMNRAFLAYIVGTPQIRVVPGGIFHTLEFELETDGKDI